MAKNIAGYVYNKSKQNNVMEAFTEAFGEKA